MKKYRKYETGKLIEGSHIINKTIDIKRVIFELIGILLKSVSKM